MRSKLAKATTLLLAVVATLWFIELVWSISKFEYPHIQAERGVPAATLLALTLAYASIHRSWRLHWLGIPLLLISSLGVIHVLPVWINGLFKEFAPLTAMEATQAFQSGLFAVATVGFMSALACLVVAKLSAGQAVREKP